MAEQRDLELSLTRVERPLASEIDLSMVSTPLNFDSEGVWKLGHVTHFVLVHARLVARPDLARLCA
jgi:hypothetical protein